MSANDEREFLSLLLTGLLPFHLSVIMAWRVVVVVADRTVSPLQLYICTYVILHIFQFKEKEDT